MAIFLSWFKKKNIISLSRVIDSRFELNEMLVGIHGIKTHDSVEYWVKYLREPAHRDFLIVALRLMDEEIERQGGKRK